VIPGVLSTVHAARVYEAMLLDPYFADGAARAKRPRWVDLPVVLVLPVGELVGECAGLALLGPAALRRPPRLERKPVDRAFLSVQGTEGVVRVRRPLFEALGALAVVPEYRAQIEVDADARRSLEPHLGALAWEHTEALAEQA